MRNKGDIARRGEIYQLELLLPPCRKSIGLLGNVRGGGEGGGEGLNFL